ncbi:MAG: hypothetical protein AVDCRST_MAG50-2053 [uncultured Acidimicrobiales bacterium]|uniref:Tyrosine specific protein phosphatases domain-containing protein n=1 Tax=uncultured Acidimicrobiales bacterium TaxID=310071 RepID=A0A6J4IBH5_9ACTN|nr:MAG: hypothetical protein AVDCRST_MAG50-2053 [uncultured Acidimicrobiales bacterium]
MKGKWERGIAPRHFSWIVKDQLAVSERPGGYARNHRKVRRHEEILWLRNSGFARVVSLLPSSHNLHAYDELGLEWSHFPLGPTADARKTLIEVYEALRGWLGAGQPVLVHQEELGDRLMGVAAGYLLYAGLIDSGPRAITIVEKMLHREMGPQGRELVALASDL